MLTLKQAAKEKLLLVAHRGVWGGNIPCNTLQAFESALFEGADMIELDVDCTADGKLVIFHPGMESAMLGYPERISRMPYDLVRQLRYINIDNVPTQYGIPTLDEALLLLRDRCFINVDKFWKHPKEISAAIRAHGMTEQVLVKSKPTKEMLDVVEEYCADMPFMAIIRTPEELEAVRARKLRFVGSEILFENDDAPVVSPAFIEKCHARGELLWCNSIVYNYREVIAGNHTDDRAMCGFAEEAWGWIADRGFDLIQTDRVLNAALFFEKTGRRVKK